MRLSDICHEVGQDEICAFTQPAFNAGHGIALVTTAHILQKMVSLPIFSSHGLQQSASKQPVGLAYRDAQIPGKGVGLVATRPLSNNDAFLSRMPIVMVDDTAFKRLGRARLTDLLTQAIGDLPQTHQAEYLNLTTHQEVKTHDEKVYEIFMKNDFITPVEGIVDFHSVFPEASEETIKESDERVEQILKLQKDLDDYSPSSAATPEKAELLVKLFEAEGLVTRMVEAYYRAALEYNGIGSAEEAVSQDVKLRLYVVANELDGS
ncbi:SET domain-containing protein 5 [Diaporthe eres]|uniref:SET domain-containing protein 5 n=1 Tax=Diaporthe eres TaxID=83184 RepID=A0ABR1P8X9_DIAER